MNRQDSNDLLSAWLDGELTPTEEEVVRHRLDNEPPLAAELERLRAASEAARSYFGRAGGDAPDLRESREAFIRTTLSGSCAAGAAPRASWMQRPWLRVASGLALVGILVLGAGFFGRSEARAASLVEAAESALDPAQFMTISVSRPGFLGHRQPINVLYGRGGRWVVEAEGSLIVPGSFGSGARSWARVRHDGRIHLGSDGGRVWLWLEGADVVKVLTLDAPPSALTYFRTLLDEAPEGQQQTPLLHWGRVQDVLEGVARGRLRYRRVGAETVSNERLIRYDVTLGDRATARVWSSPSDRAIRRVEMGLLTLSFDEPREPPSPDVFHWGSRVPAGVRVVTVR